MSLIGLALRWTGLPQWALELIAIAIIACCFWLYHHHVYETGIRAQQSADKVVSAQAEARAAAATEAAQDAANKAEEAYRAEIERNRAFAASHPLPPVRVCDDGSRSGMPEASASHSGNQSAGASSGGVLKVPAGDSGVRQDERPDISGLLGLLAHRADGVSAELREDQSR